MKKFWVFSFIVCLGCDQLTKESDKLLPPLETPPSYLSFRVEFPIQELEAGVNRALPDTLFDNAVALKNEQDTLFLKVKRTGKLSLRLRDDQVFAAIPLDIRAAIKKKVMGITFSNEDAPISFAGVLEATIAPALATDWSMQLNCQYRDFDLEGMDTFSLMGISFNLEKVVKNAMISHQDDLSNVICQAIQSGFDFKKILSNVYGKIQSPLQIARQPIALFLQTIPTALNGELVGHKTDTLSLHAEYRAGIQISPNHANVNLHQLPTRKEPLNTDNSMLLYPDVRIPYEELSSLMTNTLAKKTFQYEGYSVQITSAEVKPSGQRLTIHLHVTGDVQGLVKVSGIPVLNADRSMSLSEFKYDIKSEDNLLNMADWLSHQMVEEYFSSQVKIDTKNFFDDLDELILKGISSTPLRKKLAAQIHFDQIQTYQFRCTEEFIQWVFVVEGDAQLSLKNGLFK